VVPTDRLVEELWEGKPPSTGPKLVQIYVSHLRKLFRANGAEAVIQTRGGGYLLDVHDERVDTRRFEQLLQAAEGVEPAKAETLLTEALDLWRGPALVDFRYTTVAQNEAARLEELRLAALDRRIDAQLILGGREQQLVADLELLVAQEPLRERFRAQLILALYRSGRQADALDAYQQARAYLDDELGLEPGDELRELEAAVLRHDQSLDRPSPPERLDLPRGTVTFVFAEVAGATRRLAELGAQAYAAALHEQRLAIAASLAAHGGRELDAHGDACFYVFTRAADAIAAAEAAVDACAGQTLQPRVGIHTGEPTLTGDGYAGLDVYRAPRIAAVAHPRQILVSQATRDLVPDAWLRDLGLHRLKDLSQPERIYQLSDASFPRLDALNLSNVPVRSSPLIGRVRELKELTALLAASRLVTITGPGGIGKTRVALEAARELADDYADGVYFVELSSIVDPDLVLPAIARAVGVDETAALAGKKLLIVADNLEQVLPAGAGLAALLAEAAHLTILATSRETLHLRDERVYVLAPLPVPRLDATLTARSIANVDAAALFIERAQATDPEFAVTNANSPAIAEICVRLDGLPLALELAAARTSILTPEEIVQRFDSRLELLTAGPRDLPARQRTLRSVIAWSYDLLDAGEQGLFSHLAVFSGGFGLNAAEEIAGAALDQLTALVDKNLVRVRQGRSTLLETLREYAVECLSASDEEDEIRDRHARYFEALAERLDAEVVDDTRDQQAVLEREHDNLRAALDWLGLAPERGQRRLQLAGALGWFWALRHVPEGRSRLGEALAGTDADSPARARALVAFGEVAGRSGEMAAARPAFEEAVEIWLELGEPKQATEALLSFGFALHMSNDNPAARDAIERAVALAEGIGDEQLLLKAQARLIHLLVDQRDVAGIERLAPRALERAEKLGDRDVQGLMYHFLGDSALLGDDPAAAILRYGAGLRWALSIGDPISTALEVEGIANALAGEGRWELGLRLAAAAQAEEQARGLEQLPQFWTDLSARYLGAARDGLGAPAADRAWAAGATLAFDDAVALALESVPSFSAGVGDPARALVAER
jgi:predicted ATPase/class 3 adenylate cyclase